MKQSSNGISAGIVLLLWSVIFGCSENPAPAEQGKPETFSLSEDSIRAEQEVPMKKISPLRYENVILILGGSPSLMPPDKVELRYSQKLQKRVADNYKILNASVAGETTEPLKMRLPYLFKHDIVAVVLEVGYDEYQSSLNPKAFRQKLESVLKYKPASALPFYLLLTTDNQKYLKVIEDLTSRYDLELLIPDSPLSDEKKWQESAALLLESHLEIVR